MTTPHDGANMALSNTQDFSDNAMLELFRAEVESHTQTLNEGPHQNDSIKDNGDRPSFLSSASRPLVQGLGMAFTSAWDAAWRCR